LIRLARLGGVAAVLMATPILLHAACAGDALTTAGDILQYALPLTAAVCAQRQHRLGSYAAGFVAQAAVTQGFKHGLGDAEINQRPNGQSHGFPSGHTAAAFSGAVDLSLHCTPGNVPVALVSGAAGALVGASRIHADEHDLLQVLAGAALGALSTGLAVTRAPGGGWGVSYDFRF
jgi:membrane-associated phospholipid phosphatase